MVFDTRKEHPIEQNSSFIRVGPSVFLLLSFLCSIWLHMTYVVKSHTKASLQKSWDYHFLILYPVTINKVQLKSSITFTFLGLYQEQQCQSPPSQIISKGFKRDTMQSQGCWILKRGSLVWSHHFSDCLSVSFLLHLLIFFFYSAEEIFFNLSFLNQFSFPILFSQLVNDNLLGRENPYFQYLFPHKNRWNR